MPMEGASRFRGLRIPLAAVLAVASIFIAIALTNLASAADKRACIEKAAAQFPAQPVSAYVTRDKTAVGPLKVSFVAERARAVKKCD
jgi:hypothetical protein